MQQLNTPSVRWEWISEAWNLFTKQWSVWVMMLVAMFLVPVVAYLPAIGLGILAGLAEDGGGTIIQLLSLLYMLVFVAIMVCVMPMMAGGLYNAAFKQIRGEQIAVSDLFSGRPYFLRILGAGILLGIAAGLGSIVLVGGLIVAGLTFLTMPLIVEGGRGIIDAIKESIEITKHDWIMFTLFALALSAIANAGMIACGVGILATAPLLFLGHALAYRDCVGMRGQQRQEQFMPPPSPEYRSYSPPQAPAPQAQPWAAPTFVTPPPQPPQPESSTGLCPHCGATLARTMNFCNQCGRPLRGA
ncbi:MAG TPA: zinc-ribbon domain-containing protein [Blastocatellia bacterium]|nr:zinc-ribbon domain-containing protein [Blastocatellia bacterium]